MDSEALAQVRRDKDEFLRSHYASPLPEEDQEGFPGLSYFPPSPDPVYVGRYVPGDDSPIQITSSLGTMSPYHKMGTFHVTIAHTDYALTVLDDGDGNPFIAFADSTNAVSTYGGGRYVALDLSGEGTASIDFDMATNPYCVYDEEFVCPLPPLENRISIPIEAGEKMYGGSAGASL
jgi:uncharacterized protein (DUF1684 family)